MRLILKNKKLKTLLRLVQNLKKIFLNFLYIQLELSES